MERPCSRQRLAPGAHRDRQPLSGAEPGLRRPSDGPFTLAIVSDRHFDRWRSLEHARADRRLSEQRGPDGTTGETGPKAGNSLFKTEKADHWVTLLGEAGLPAGHVLTIPEALGDPQARHNEMIVEYEHPVAGTVRSTGSPIHIDGSPARAAATPATLGQHTRSILREMGVDPATIDEMVAAGTAIVS